MKCVYRLRPVRSGLPFSGGVMLVQFLNPYPLHYTGAFAFSDFLYPLDVRLQLLSAYSVVGQQRVYWTYRVSPFDDLRIG
ncbi:MAG: hypothetical protein AAFO04_25665 [Cyanobacteria bacterium J06592_8]|uniref:hypothetical protein n=1 Tax=Limnoraphis robusta TaxID=1118279 RepID=UPI002B201DC2|nr:hypothetical protein [Limnoraphis robusta]MEA5500941.1 hypothetical protein [Limnoraphis robusta BA-68 BA1]MEA5540869.1 hypothetical protein [Limnoraphis robusta Tam1]